MRHGSEFRAFGVVTETSRDSLVGADDCWSLLWLSLNKIHLSVCCHGGGGDDDDDDDRCDVECRTVSCWSPRTQSWSPPRSSRNLGRAMRTCCRCWSVDSDQNIVNGEGVVEQMAFVCFLFWFQVFLFGRKLRS